MTSDSIQLKKKETNMPARAIHDESMMIQLISKSQINDGSTGEIVYEEVEYNILFWGQKVVRCCFHRPVWHLLKKSARLCNRVLE